MVSHQIDDVHCKFQRLEELERNDWVIEDVPKKKPMKVCVYHSCELPSLLCIKFTFVVLKYFVSGCQAIYMAWRDLHCMTMEFPRVSVYVGLFFYGNSGVSEAMQYIVLVNLLQ